MKVAATSGCFSLLHRGHIHLFQEMRELVGEKGLVLVLVNNDKYVYRTKGQIIAPLEDRMAILLALRNVDIVIPFKDNDPCRMIQIIEPTFWAKGPEYKDIEIPETPVVASYGGKIVFSQGGSTVHTRDILSRIKQTGDYTNSPGTDFAL